MGMKHKAVKKSGDILYAWEWCDEHDNNMRGATIKNVGAPVDPADAVRKTELDAHKASIDNHDDIVITTPTNGEVLTYDSVTAKWTNRAPIAAGYNVVIKTANYVALDRDCVLADASAAALTITLPSPTANAEVIVKKIDATANTVTISPAATETIDGATSLVLDTQYEAYHLISDGTNWFII